MRLGRRLSAGIAEDPPAPDAPQVPADEAATPISAEHTGIGQREPAEQLVDR